MNLSSGTRQMQCSFALVRRGQRVFELCAEPHLRYSTYAFLMEDSDPADFFLFCGAGDLRACQC